MTILSGRRVLVVEDEYLLAMDIADTVTVAGGVVEGPFATVGEALQALAGAAIDVAVLNVRVRDGSAYPLATSLRDRGIPFLFATGRHMAGEPPEWQRAPWIGKPYDTGQLVRMLADLVVPKSQEGGARMDGGTEA